ncbi:MAG: NADH:flavin oxidoreductase, partial [Steroidobacteraceae bacterium]|nr:NADH:flavin oxidoreductase [Steroidobacteraceae bacterium]
VTPSAGVGHMIPHESVAPMLARLGGGNAAYRVLSALDGLEDGGVRIVNLTSGEEDVVACGLVVVQTGRVAAPAPESALRQAGIAEIHRVGDCITPRRMSFAVFEAQRVGRRL